MIYDVNISRAIIINYILNERIDPIAYRQCVKRMSIFAMQKIDCHGYYVIGYTYLPITNLRFPRGVEVPVLAALYTIRKMW